MVRRLTGAVAAGDRERQGAVVSTAFFVTVGLTLAGGAAIAVLLAAVSVPSLFGAGFSAHAEELMQTAWVSLGIFLVLMILACLERVREGFQEVHIGNAFGSVFNVSAALLLWAGIRHYPTPVFVVVAVYGFLILFSSANAVSLLCKRPWLVPSPRKADPALLRPMIGEGLALFAAGSVAPILIREAPKFMLGRPEHHGGAADVAHYWILIQLGLIGLGFVMMVTRPLWPAMADAACRNDYSWIRAARTRTIKLFAPCAVIVISAFSLLGGWFTRWWLQTDAGLTRFQFTAYGVLFVLTAWSHIHYVLLGSMGLARAAARILITEAVLILALTWWWIHWQGLSGAILASAAGMAAVSAWLLPLALSRALREKSVAEAPVQAPLLAAVPRA
jgi:O-antigen/teichoic acid export membrane protein